jgi:hypothetical protein
MCLIRRTALAAAGGWSSDTIVEDTDLGLSLLEHGWLNRFDANDVLKEVDQVLWALQPLDVAAQDDTIPAGVGELDSLTE